MVVSPILHNRMRITLLFKKTKIQNTSVPANYYCYESKNTKIDTNSSHVHSTKITVFFKMLQLA